MAITSVDGLVKGMVPPIYFNKGIGSLAGVGIPFDLSSASGIPGSMAVSTAGVAGETLVGNYPGSLPWSRPTTGRTYLLRATYHANQPGVMLLCDMLWRNSGLSTSITTAQTVNSIPWPARDKNYTTLGEGVTIGVELTTASTANTPTLSASFTASDGTTGNTSTNLIPTLAASPAGFVYPLVTSKKGTQSIQSFTLSSAWTSAVISLMAYRVISRMDSSNSSIGFTFTFPFEGMEQIPTDACLFWMFIPTTTASPRIYGSLVLTQG
jgi:hypothetical protein